MGKVIVIVGPTASGKTKLAIELAKKLDGEIISADSMQLYKFMDIGTAKPSDEEMQGVKHYLIDELNPDKDFSVVQFKNLAEQYIDFILQKRKVPIIAGGTGFYINSVLNNVDFSEASCDQEFRDILKNEANRFGNNYLHQKLFEIDPRSAGRIHANDTKRIIRALEVHKITGKTISYYQDMSLLNPAKHVFMIYGLTADRELLYKRIENRVDEMFENGLVEEVRALIGKGYGRELVSMQGLGYKELMAYFHGECTYKEAVDLIKKNTRHFAKRQLTWFRRDERITWLDMDQIKIKEAMDKIFTEYLENKGNI